MAHSSTSRVTTDDHVGALIQIVSAHHLIHHGLRFTASRSAAIGDGQSVEYLIRCANVSKEFHMQVIAANSRACTIFFFENPTVVAEGTPVTVLNRNRDSAESANITLFHTPTLGGDGTALQTEQVGTTGGSAIPGVQRDTDEWNLKANEDYLVRLTNAGGGAGTATVRFEWYEIPDAGLA
jgi:hypothetical protein